MDIKSISQFCIKVIMRGVTNNVKWYFGGMRSCLKKNYLQFFYKMSFAKIGPRAEEGWDGERSHFQTGNKTTHLLGDS